MANQNYVPSERLFVYKSSLEKHKKTGIVVLALGAFLLSEAIYALVKYAGSEEGTFIFLERFVFGSILLGLVGYVYYTNRDRIVTVTRTQITCTTASKTIAIPMAQLKVLWPKRGQKKNRVVTLCDGPNMFPVSETFFPEFDDLMTKLKAFDQARQEKRKEHTLDET